MLPIFSVLLCRPICQNQTKSVPRLIDSVSTCPYLSFRNRRERIDFLITPPSHRVFYSPQHKPRDPSLLYVLSTLVNNPFFVLYPVSSHSDILRPFVVLLHYVLSLSWVCVIFPFLTTYNYIFSWSLPTYFISALFRESFEKQSGLPFKSSNSL